MTEDLDVRHLPYMPLHIERLRKSKSWLRCKRNPELAFYLMNLWMRAWHELPAGSIENDDDVLADAAMCDPDHWPSIRAELMQSWEERDGRVFHPVVEELVAEAAQKLRGNQKRTAAAREAAAAVRSQRSEASVTDTATGSVTDDEGRREGNISTSDDVDRAGAPAPKSVEVSREAKPTPRSILESVIDPNRAAALVDHRKRKRAPLGDHAAQLLADKLARFVEPNRAADLIIEKGWQTIEPDWAGAPPLKPSSAPTAIAPPRSFVSERDARYGPLRDRWRREHRKQSGPPLHFAQGAEGYDFPSEWIEALPLEKTA